VVSPPILPSPLWNCNGTVGRLFLVIANGGGGHRAILRGERRRKAEKEGIFKNKIGSCVETEFPKTKTQPNPTQLKHVHCCFQSHVRTQGEPRL